VHPAQLARAQALDAACHGFEPFVGFFSPLFFSVDFGLQALLLLNTPPGLLSAPHCFIYFYLLIIYLFYF
jgi:hypothetical protein